MAALSAGTLSIIATANDSDNNDNASGLPTLPQNTNKDSTSTRLSSSTSSPKSDSSVPFTAEADFVAHGSDTPMGTVTFYDGTATPGTVTISKWFRWLQHFQTGGRNPPTVTATYNGNSNFSGSSGSVPQTITSK